MKEVKRNKYHGCLISSSVTESIANTVDVRLGLATKAIYEIRSVIEDSRANKLGAVEMGLSLWEGSVLSSLLAGCEVWSDIPSKTMKKLTDINTLFLANLLGVSKRGCPAASLYIETASLPQILNIPRLLTSCFLIWVITQAGFQYHDMNAWLKANLPTNDEVSGQSIFKWFPLSSIQKY